MKSIVYLSLCVLSLQQLSSSIIPDYLFGSFQNEGCNIQSGCSIAKKFKAIFPQDGQDAPSELNFFTVKTIYLYSDHLSVYRDMPDKLVLFQTQLNNPPSQIDFLSNYPLSPFITCCKNYFCTLKEFVDFYETISPQALKIPDAVESEFGITKKDNCLVLAQDLLAPEGFIYLCSGSTKDIFNFKLRLDYMKNQIQIYESVAKVSMISQAQDSFQESFLHFNNDKIVINNSPDELKDVENSDDFKQLLMAKLDLDFLYPAASTYQDSIQLPWNGNPKLKPDIKRCFKLHLKMKNSQGIQSLRYSHFCVFGSADGSQPYTIKEAYIAINQWIIEINKQVALRNQQKYQNVIDKFSSKDIDDFISLGSQVTNYVKYSLYEQSNIISKICEIIVGDKSYDFKECQLAKQKAIVDLMGNICRQNRACIKYLTQDITSGEVPLSSENNRVAWDLFNPYRYLDIMNQQPALLRVVNNPDRMQNQNPTLDKSSVVSRSRPSKEEIYKMMNTIQQIFQGNDIDDLDSLNSKGFNLGGVSLQSSYNANRALYMLQYATRYDPWSEYLGHVTNQVLGY